MNIGKIARGVRGWTIPALALFLASDVIAQQKPSQVEVKAFLKADKNEDLHLSKREFRVFVNAMAEAGQSTAKRIRFFRAYGYAFSVVDKNKDGILSPAELRSADNDYRAGKS